MKSEARDKEGQVKQTGDISAFTSLPGFHQAMQKLVQVPKEKVTAKETVATPKKKSQNKKK